MGVFCNENSTERPFGIPSNRKKCSRTSLVLEWVGGKGESRRKGDSGVGKRHEKEDAVAWGHGVSVLRADWVYCTVSVRVVEAESAPLTVSVPVRVMV